MTPEQQHHIRNGVISIFAIASRLERYGNLSEDNLEMVLRIRSECCRIGGAIGMGGASPALEERKGKSMEKGKRHSGLGSLAIIVISIVLLPALLSGCAGLKVASARPEGCEQSIIYDRVPAPQITGAVSVIALNELAMREPAAKPYIVGAIDRALDALKDDQVTYVELARLVVENVEWVNNYFGSRLVAYSALLDVFDQPIPIYPCDRMVIRKHLERLEAALGA